MKFERRFLAICMALALAVSAAACTATAETLSDGSDVLPAVDTVTEDAGEVAAGGQITGDAATEEIGEAVAEEHGNGNAATAEAGAAAADVPSDRGAVTEETNADAAEEQAAGDAAAKETGEDAAEEQAAGDAAAKENGEDAAEEQAAGDTATKETGEDAAEEQAAGDTVTEETGDDADEEQAAGDSATEETDEAVTKEVTDEAAAEEQGDEDAVTEEAAAVDGENETPSGEQAGGMETDTPAGEGGKTGATEETDISEIPVAGTLNLNDPLEGIEIEAGSTLVFRLTVPFMKELTFAGQGLGMYLVLEKEEEYTGETGKIRTDDNGLLQAALENVEAGSYLVTVGMEEGGSSAFTLAALDEEGLAAWLEAGEAADPAKEAEDTAEAIEEEPEETAAPAMTETPAAMTPEETPPEKEPVNRTVRVVSSLDEEDFVYQGMTVRLRAELDGFLDTDRYTLQWYYSPDGGTTLIPVEGATEPVYWYRMDEETYHWSWQAEVTLLEDAEAQ